MASLAGHTQCVDLLIANGAVQTPVPAGAADGEEGDVEEDRVDDGGGAELDGSPWTMVDWHEQRDEQADNQNEMSYARHEWERDERTGRAMRRDRDDDRNRPERSRSR